MQKYHVTVNIVYAGHPKIDPATGKPGVSHFGHTGLTLTDGQGNSISAGFAPKDVHGTLASVKGRVYDDDDIRYSPRPAAYSRTIEISQSEYNSVIDFIYDPLKYGFDTDYSPFALPRNNCNDFVWKALEQAGLNPQQFKGKMLPFDNIVPLQNLDPQGKGISDDGFLRIPGFWPPDGEQEKALPRSDESLPPVSSKSSPERSALSNAKQLSSSVVKTPEVRLNIPNGISLAANQATRIRVELSRPAAEDSILRLTLDAPTRISGQFLADVGERSADGQTLYRPLYPAVEVALKAGQTSVAINLINSGASLKPDAETKLEVQASYVLNAKDKAPLEKLSNSISLNPKTTHEASVTPKAKKAEVHERRVVDVAPGD